MARVKVCGFRQKAALDAAVEAGVDAVGAIVDVPVDTPREVDADTARELFASVPPFVSTVLVTMPESVSQARTLVGAVEPDALQVHAGLAPAEIEALADEVPTLAGVDPDEPAIEAYARAADGLIVDSTDESGAGGTGRTHDWTATRDLALEAPIVLAGGLTPGNVAQAVEAVEPFAVDVASGVEADPGRKDPDLMTAFVEAAGR